MKIYLIPGLGYDGRIFDRLVFSGYKVVCLDWVEPLKQEGLSDYARRLFQGVPEDEEVVLIGHSLGGIVAQEIAAMRSIATVVLLSSIRSRAEMPFCFKIVKPLGLHRLFTKELSVATVRFWGAKHGIVSTAEQDLFKSMVGNHSNAYLQWALKALSGWSQPGLPPDTDIFQIHGTEDQTFPIELIKEADVIIEGGTHVMVYTQAQEVETAVLSALGR